MNHLLSKKHLNNEKSRLIRGKIAKTAVTFHKNKPNPKNVKIGVNSFETSIYEILSAGSGEKTIPSKPNLSQYKPDSNPIYGMAKFALSSFMTSKYV